MENNQQTDQLHSVSPTASYSPSKAFIILMVILLILAVGLGGYILGAKQNQIAQNQTQSVTLSPAIQPSPTVDPTADRETYTDNTYYFSIKYPLSWTLYEYKGTHPPKDNKWQAAAIIVLKPGPDSFEPGITGIYNTVSLSINRNDGGLPLVDWIKQHEDIDRFLPNDYYQSIKVGNHEAIKINFTPTADIKKFLNSKGYLGGQGGEYYSYISVYIKKELLIYKLLAIEEKNSELFNTFDQILSTFKFTRLVAK